MGGIYASGIAGLSFLRKNIRALQGKRIFVFCDGASLYDEEAFHALVQHNFSGDLSGIPCFYLRGAWNLPGMTLTDRTLCRMLQKSVAKKNPADCAIWEKALLEAGETVCDWTDRAALAPLLASLRA